MNITRCVLVGIGLALLLALVSTASAHPIYLHSNTFDTDPIGGLPAGWTLRSGTVNPANTSVQAGGVFRVGYTTESFQIGVTYGPHSLDTPGDLLAYEMDFYVDTISNNGSDGINIYNRNNATGILAGNWRVVNAGSGNWQLYNEFYTIAPSETPYGPPFPMDDWGRLRVEYLATSPSAGQVRYFLGDDVADLRTSLADDLFYTEFYSGSTAATLNIQEFLITTVTVNGASYLIDNFTIVTPEPASLGVIATAAGTVLLRRRRRT